MNLKGNKMQKVYGYMDKLEEWLLFSGFSIVIIVVFGQVVLRYLFHNALPWVEELARYMFIYLTWIGADRAVRDDKHIKLTLLENKVYSKYLDIVVTLICLITFVLLTYYGMELLGKLRRNVHVSPTLHLPMWYFYFAVPLGGILMSIRYTYKLFCLDLPMLRKAR
jgi:C4-dicarboxylate transporter DctQ subunit